ncbi:DUF5047 domain-containing protein [[Kitasatospora] papulosa]
MYAVSARFLAALGESHRVITKVQLIRTDNSQSVLPHIGGSVVADRGQAIRRTCTITSAQVSLIPSTPAEERLLYGARLRVSRGIDYGDGTSELVPLGTFRLDEIGGDPTFGPVTLSGKSLECVIQDDKFTQPYRATGTVSSAATELIRRSLPTADVLVLSTNPMIGSRTWDIGADPWAAVQEIAAVAGAEAYTNADGVFVIAPLPNVLTTPPVWTVAAGERGVYIKGERSMSAAGVNNGYLASGENAQDGAAPVSYLATDNDATSPTRWTGPFGRRPAFYSSSTLITTAACQAAAELKLAAARAPNARGSFSSLPNPALEPTDVIRVVHPSGLSELHQAQAFTVPVGPAGDFPITTISAKED